MGYKRNLAISLLYVFFAYLALTWLIAPLPSSSQAVRVPNILAPQLKWQYGGCTSWCQTGWYSSPAAIDLDRDGKVEVIGASYSVFILDGATGSLEKTWDPPGGRQWPSLVVVDLEKDGDLEIVTAQSDGYLNVFDHFGNNVWSRQPTPGYELRSLATYDLDGNGDLEIIVASTRSEDQWFVYEHDGSLRPGEWPQHGPDSNTNGYTSGCYNENVAAGDTDGDGRAEIFGPNDTHYLAFFNDDGTQVRANSMYGLNPDGSNKFWSRVGVHVDHSVDIRGYAQCGTEHRPNFAASAPVIVDVNRDGSQEAIVVGNVYNCGTSPYTSLYEIPYILNSDRTRWSKAGFDWTEIPLPDSNAAPLTENWEIIENNQPNAVAADLDGDGFFEILHSSYDGRMHAYWLDKTEHGSWPYSVFNPAEGFYRFASEPTIADLDADGHAEVVFASWVEKGSNQTGYLHILDYLGNPLQVVSLPDALGNPDWNGALAAPTLANIDADPDIEVILNTAHSGLVAYDLPGTSQARLIWPTGRGNYQRSGSYLHGDLTGSRKQVSRHFASPGDLLTYTIHLMNSGPAFPSASMTDTLPVGVQFAGSLHATSGVVGYSNGTVTWNGSIATNGTVQISFQALVDNIGAGSYLITNLANLDDGFGNQMTLSAYIVIDGFGMYLPFFLRLY